jgi:hypothetical protein
MNSKISNFTYVSTQTLQNAFPEGLDQRPLQISSQPISPPKKALQAYPKKGAAPKRIGRKT